MNLIESRLQTALDAAVALITLTIKTVVDRVADALVAPGPADPKASERDAMLAALSDLRRNLQAFHRTFASALRDQVRLESAPRDSTPRRLASTDWQTLSLVEDNEVEGRLYADRIGQMISHACDSVMREVATYTGTLLRNVRADDDRNPLRAEVLGGALYRAIEATTDVFDSRKLLSRELGQAAAQAMPACYADIVLDFQGRGIEPLSLSVRTVDGPGNRNAPNSGYTGLPKDAAASAHSAFDGAAGSPPGGSTRGGSLQSPLGTSQGARSSGQGGLDAGLTAASSQADLQLMQLLRRLTTMASRHGDLADSADESAGTGSAAARAKPQNRASAYGGAGSADVGFQDAGLPPMMAVNLIRAHREELMHASVGKLDHMVIDVVGSLFDQILSDNRVPPQMARQIARLQLPVLRVALNDASFFSSRRHPVRRFINRVASLACAFDDFEDGPGKQVLQRVSDVVKDIVEGDFDQVELYAKKLDVLEGFIAQQTHAEAHQNGAAATLESKESELRLQQRYMLQLQTTLQSLPMQPYLRDFLSQVWTQAIVMAVRREGTDSDRARRYKRAAGDLVMSVQPKGSPILRKKFLMQLPMLMKDLNEGMHFVGWPEVARKAFFNQLLPAHADSLKGQPLSELDYNMLAKKAEAVFTSPVPGVESLTQADTAPVFDESAVRRRFSAEEVRQVGLVEESTVDWSGKVDIEVGAEPVVADDPTPLNLGVDINLDMSTADPSEPSRGPQLVDHVKLGFAYQMHLKDEWQKVRLTYLSPARSFFVFSSGRKHQETISMTSRMLARMCESGRMRAVESAYLMERATQRARKQLAALKAPALH